MDTKKMYNTKSQTSKKSTSRKTSTSKSTSTFSSDKKRPVNKKRSENDTYKSKSRFDETTDQKPKRRSFETPDRPKRRPEERSCFRSKSYADETSDNRSRSRSNETSDRPKRRTEEKSNFKSRSYSDKTPNSRSKYGSSERADKPKRRPGETNSFRTKSYSDEAADRNSRYRSNDFHEKRNKPRSGERSENKRYPSSQSRENRFEAAEKTAYRKPYDKTERTKPYSDKPRKPKQQEGIRLNKYIANAGICSRRDADTLIESGAVMINGKVCTQLGTRVMPGDSVQFGGETLNTEKKVYVLMNKPKGYITTTDDPQERKTVMELIKDACRERIYPVGRLDRQTTGVLLFTNDGDLAKKLTHPSHGARKIYHVTLDQNITKKDLQSIGEGVELEDGFVHVDEVSYIGASKDEVGIQLHSGMNRVVRRIFEKYGYKVVKLDRVLFAELTKKDLPRGRYRILSEKEINFLKMLKANPK